MFQPIRVGAVIAAAPFSRYQQRVILICLGVGLAEGINALSIGYVLPTLSVQYEIAPAAFAIIFVTALLGEIVGNFLLAPLGDKFGRRSMLRVGIVVFGLAAIPSALVGSVEALAACRFVAGLGIGAAVPSVFTLASDFTPDRAKGRVISILSMSISAGGFLIGLISVSFLPAFGGSAFLLLGGILPLILLITTWRIVPESVEYLAEKGRHKDVHRTLHRIAPGLVDERNEESVSYVPAETVKGVRLVQLFRNRRGLPTLMLWILNFSGVFNVYFIFAFLATLLILDGIPAGTALLGTSLATLGGMIGGVSLGYLMDRTRMGPAAGALGSAVAITGFLVLSATDSTAPEAVFLVLGAALGLGAIGANSCSQVLATQIYPPAVRATGFGWFSAIGRLGGVAAPIVIGAMLTAGVSNDVLYRLAAIPNALVGILLIVFTIYSRLVVSKAAPSTLDGDLTAV